MAKELFKNTKVNPESLLSYGFVQENNDFKYVSPILGEQFLLTVYVKQNGTVSTKMVESLTNEEYVLHLIPDAVGEFVGKIRHEYESLLLDIKDKCFEKFIFKSTQAQELIDYVKAKYDGNLEYLWQKFPSNAVWRRKDNQKWYGALLVISKRKLGINSDEIVEIIDLRTDSQCVESIIDNKKYYPGYHMNKKHWFTIILDGSVTTKEITGLIDISYNLAKK